MSLNKKFIYDGNKIIKVGARELYPYVYKRVWDLSKFDSDILNKYGLEQKEYVYIGRSSETYLSDRTAKFKHNIENKHCVNKYILEFIDNLKRFYKYELSYSDSMIDKIIIPAGEVVCRCENKEDAKDLEKIITGYYIFYNVFDDNYRLLSDRDSVLKPIKNKKKSYRFI